MMSWFLWADLVLVVGLVGILLGTLRLARKLWQENENLWDELTRLYEEAHGERPGNSPPHSLHLPRRKDVL